MTKGQTSVLARLLVSQSGEQDRRTPLEVFKELDNEFNFELDPCTSSEKNGNLGTPFYFNKEQDGLKQDWSKFKSIFINPPFNQLPKKKWEVKCFRELELAQQENREMTIVLLVPSKTETDWYHKFLTSKFLKEVRFQKGRMTFEGHNTAFIIGITYFILNSEVSAE